MPLDGRYKNDHLHFGNTTGLSSISFVTTISREEEHYLCSTTKETSLRLWSEPHIATNLRRMPCQKRFSLSCRMPTSLVRTTEGQEISCRRSHILMLHSTGHNTTSTSQVLPEILRFSTRSILLTTLTIWPFWWEKGGRPCRKPRSCQTWTSVHMTPSSFPAVWRRWSICLNIRC